MDNNDRILAVSHGPEASRAVWLDAKARESLVEHDVAAGMLARHTTPGVRWRTPPASELKPFACAATGPTAAHRVCRRAVQTYGCPSKLSAGHIMSCVNADRVRG